MFTHAHSFYKGFVETGGGGPPWEYASLAAAESSGDSWADGVDVTITGGALFIYDATLAVDSYSGLIHKYPWDGTGTIATLDQVDSIFSSTAQGSDPDTWADFTKSGAGTTDVDGGRSRIMAPTTSDTVTMASDHAVVTANLESFMIIDAIGAGLTGTDSSSSAPYIYNVVGARNAADTAAEGVALVLNRVDSTTLWSVQRGAGLFTVTTKSIATERRAWLYVKEDRWAVWFDADSVPEKSGTVTWSGIGSKSTLRSQSFAATTDVFQKLNQVAIGSMTTS